MKKRKKRIVKPPTNKTFSISDRIKSFGYAFNGILIMLKSQHNAWIHLAFSGVVMIAGILFKFKPAEWCWILLSIMAVWMAEAFNTALEFLADVISPEIQPLIGKAKDVAAGAVLLAAFGSAAVGVLVFGPHFLALF